MKKVYYIITAVVQDPKKLKIYGEMAAVLIKKYDGKIIVSERNPEIFEGDNKGNLHVVIEFPSKEKAKGWYNDPDYAEAKKLRLEASDSISFILVDGKLI